MKVAAAFARWVLATVLALGGYISVSQAYEPVPRPYYYPATPAGPDAPAGYRASPPAYAYGPTHHSAAPSYPYCPPGQQPATQAPSTRQPQPGTTSPSQTDGQAGDAQRDTAGQRDNLFDQQQQSQNQQQSAPPSSVASASSAVAPNMIGDFFGGAGACSLGRVFVGQAAFHPVGTAFGVDDYHLIAPGVQAGTATFVGGAQGDNGVAFVGGTPAGGGAVTGVTGFNRPGQTFTAVPTGGVVDVTDPAGPFFGLPVFDIFYDEVICIPSPSTNGVGRVKLAENGSPIPRDRVFVNYSNFRNVEVTGRPINVNRFVPGLEETFYDGNMSIEVRVPFASTNNADLTTDASTDTHAWELGNLSVLWKTHLISNCQWYFSAGLQVTAPTADGVRVFSPNGTLLVDIQNDAVHLMPFLGMLYTPNEQFFAQAFLQADTNVQDHPVSIRNPVTGQLESLGGLDDTNFLYFDLSLGYWVYRNNSRCAHSLTGISPIFEFHYNSSLQDPDSIQANGFRVGGMNDSLDIVNFVAGLTLEFGQDALLTVGYTLPATGEEDRDFDGELRVLANLRFGGNSPRSPF